MSKWKIKIIEIGLIITTMMIYLGAHFLQAYSLFQREGIVIGIIIAITAIVDWLLIIGFVMSFTVIVLIFIDKKKVIVLIIIDEGN